MKIVSIIGARPNFIKAYALSKVLKENGIDEVIVHTGQHYDYEMSKMFFEELNIDISYHLEIGSALHGKQTGKMMIKIEKILLKENPDMVIVFGDTNSTLAGALTASKLNINVAHVEAGCRSFDREMPEETNRVIVDHCSDILFAPTQSSYRNLMDENVFGEVHITGDIMVETCLENSEILKSKSVLDKYELERRSYGLMTVHRAENTNSKNLADIIDAISQTTQKIVFPVHPRTRKYLEKYRLGEKMKDNVTMIDPLNYSEFLSLLGESKFLLTDSGGAQKEAYILKIPCITLRKNTEWVETVDEGWNRLVGTDKKLIIDSIINFKPDIEQKSIFGDGDASKKMVDIIKDVI